MKKIKLITDSTCDLPKHIVDKYDIEVIPLIIHINHEQYHDGVDIDTDQLLERMKEEGTTATTAQINPARFLEIYERYIKEGCDILSIHLSSYMSGTFQSAVIARDMLSEGHVTVIDSKNVTSGLGLLVLKAAKLIEEGKALEEIEKLLEELIPTVESLLVFESLDNLVKGGRLSKTAGLLGSVLGIKVMLGVVEGNMAVKEKFRGSKKALKSIIETLEEKGTKAGEPIMLLSIENKDIYEPLKEYLEEKGIEYIDNKVGCTVGIHSGPRACGIFYFN